MTLKEMKFKVLALIEELEKTEPGFTKDPDIENKLNYVINQIQYELSRVKKIPAYIEMEVSKDDLIDFKTLGEKTECEVYQLAIVKGVENEYKANGTIIKVLEDGIAEIEFFKYPKAITEETPDDYEFELSSDVLEIMPYGVAWDTLKSDVSNAYGNVYGERYESMKQQLDIRYNTGSVEFCEGVVI